MLVNNAGALAPLLTEPEPDTSLVRPLGTTVSYQYKGWAVDEREFHSTLRAVADESAMFLTWAESVNVGDLTIEQIHGEIRRIARNYLKAPTLPLFERTRGLRDRIFTLLSGHQRPSHSRDLYSAAGWSLTLLAWISTDLGHPDAAEEHLQTAWLCADNADQNNLRAWIRATQHTVARWQDNFAKAARYAEDGLQYAKSGSAELFLASAWALDLTRCRDLERSQIALSRARKTAENVDKWTDDLAGPFACSEGRAGGFWSEVHLALNQPVEALSIADQAISTFESTSNDVRNLGSERMVRCRQVQAHLLLNELEGAQETLLPVLTTAPEHRVRPLVQMVDNIAQMAGLRHRTSPIALDIREAAVEFGKIELESRCPP